MTVLKDKQVAILVADMFERVELVEPREALERAGATTELVSLEEGEVQGFEHYDRAETVRVDRTVEEASAHDYDALLLPGGVGNPDALRQDENAVRFVRGFFDQGKPVAAICHAPWILIEAGVVRGRTLTSFPSLQTDLRNAGATWVDEEVVVDGNLVTSRRPDDLAAFTRELVELFARERTRVAADSASS
jgi:protease I